MPLLAARRFVQVYRIKLEDRLSALSVVEDRLSALSVVDGRVVR
jgi:hypothetical protein